MYLTYKKKKRKMDRETYLKVERKVFWGRSLTIFIEVLNKNGFKESRTLHTPQTSRNAEC